MIALRSNHKANARRHEHTHSLTRSLTLTRSCRQVETRELRPHFHFIQERSPSQPLVIERNAEAVSTINARDRTRPIARGSLISFLDGLVRVL